MMTLTLTPDLEHALVEQARAQGTTAEVLALDSLRQCFLLRDAQVRDEGQTLAEYLQGFVGVLHSSEQVEGGARMSDSPGSKFGAGMVHKRDAGTF